MRHTWVLTALFCLILSLPALAQEEEGENSDEVRYFDMTPALVTNYGGPGRMKYIKAEISIRVDSADAYRAVTHHHPSLRHAMIMLLSRQTDDSIATAEAKETLRVAALEELRGVMESEEGDPMIEDILFSSFFVQK